ncbi:MAG: hypothetical protein AUJ49_00945 [Desulfovibrionaceae bacterium CG1_02_65_16]|nr:MAG: hypothetical protein AUJ49_00945 [Desulfovibrionaceae bacterium CG1_02_65_16]
MADDGLLRELAGIEDACGHGDAEACPDGPLCLLRVVDGLDAKSWLRLKHDLELTNWQAAPPARLTRSGEFARAAADALLNEFLLDEMERARLCQQPLALAFIAPEEPSALDTVFDLVNAQLRRFDLAARLRTGLVAVVLSGTPLASAERTLGAMLRRIRQVSEPSLVCSAGLVGYGGLAELQAGALIKSAQAALDEARRLGGNRLEVAPSVDAVLASRETLVRASEKHFLFTGKKLPE